MCGVVGVLGGWVGPLPSSSRHGSSGCGTVGKQRYHRIVFDSDQTMAIPIHLERVETPLPAHPVMSEPLLVSGANAKGAAYDRSTLYSDSDVIAASLDDPSRFGDIFDRYSRRVFGYVVRRVPREDAADLTGDVFLRAFRFRHKYDLDRAEALPWLLGIATNVIGEYLRKRSRRMRIGLRPDVLPGPPVDDIATDRADAAKAWPALERTLLSLKPRDRSVLILYAIEDLTYQEIGDALNIPEGTVKSRLNRARTQASELLRPSQQTTYDEENL